MPPTAPATTIAGSSHAPWPSWNSSASPLDAMAPTVSCPSAPMFQTLARKPTASPIAISTSGAAFSASSASPLTLLTGATKKAWNAAAGSLPISENSTKPLATVSSAAITGDAHIIAREGAARASSLSRMARYLRPLRSVFVGRERGVRPQPAHPDADLLHVGVARPLRRRQPALRDHGDPVAHLEQLVELLRDDEDRGARVAQVDQRLADERGGADVDAPRRLRHDQHLRRLQDLAADDELL